MNLRTILLIYGIATIATILTVPKIYWNSNSIFTLSMVIILAILVALKVYPIRRNDNEMEVDRNKENKTS